jgi:hypothetical protein
MQVGYRRRSDRLGPEVLPAIWPTIGPTCSDQEDRVARDLTVLALEGLQIGHAGLVIGRHAVTDVEHHRGTNEPLYRDRIDGLTLS